MIDIKLVPDHILDEGSKALHTTRVVPLGRPKRLSQLEEDIVSEVSGWKKDEVFPFVIYRSREGYNLSAYKRALLRAQDDESMFCEALVSEDVVVFKQGNKVMLWKQK